MPDAEHKEIVNRIPIGSDGKPIMPLSTFIRGAISNKQLVAVDREVERYKAYSSAKIGNNLNQIARRLNEDHRAEIIDLGTYDYALSELAKIKAELRELLAPLR